MHRRLASLTLALLVLAAAGAGTAHATTRLASPDGDWSWPLSPPHPVLRPFVAPVTPYAPGHRGIDIGGGGTQVLAPAAGVVSFAGVVVDRPVLSIRHPGGLVSSYEPVEPLVSTGDAVSRGQVIGTLLPGHCGAPCLHLGVRLNGQYVSPMNYLGSVHRPVLLPTRRGGG